MYKYFISLNLKRDESRRQQTGFRSQKWVSQSAAKSIKVMSSSRHVALSITQPHQAVTQTTTHLTDEPSEQVLCAEGTQHFRPGSRPRLDLAPLDSRLQFQFLVESPDFNSLVLFLPVL
ncbi:hypothetical protein ACLKA7_016951 [Drosophila subpalustris]